MGFYLAQQYVLLLVLGVYGNKYGLVIELEISIIISIRLFVFIALRFIDGSSSVNRINNSLVIPNK